MNKCRCAGIHEVRECGMKTALLPICPVTFCRAADCHHMMLVHDEGRMGREEGDEPQ